VIGLRVERNGNIIGKDRSVVISKERLRFSCFYVHHNHADDEVVKFTLLFLLVLNLGSF
jgi:hypothetical protein